MLFRNTFRNAGVLGAISSSFPSFCPLFHFFLQIFPNVVDTLRRTDKEREKFHWRHGVDFTDILRAFFALVDPESVKNTVKSSVSFDAFGLRACKSCTLNIDEIEPRGRFHQHFTSRFYKWRSQKCQKYSQVVCLFCTLGICMHTRILVKLIPGVNFINILQPVFLPVDLHWFFWRKALSIKCKSWV
jgi:hypothetical protein